MIPTGLRPLALGQPPGEDDPEQAGSPFVTPRNRAMPVLEKPCSSVRNRLVSCADGALKKLVRNAARPSRKNRQP